MDLDTRLVRYFVAVADELHFGRAAAKLYISQPALSKQIRKLENDVGTQLLVRDSRHVTLTPRGELFLEDARQLLVLTERMRHVPDTNAVRIAHIFELETSRLVADAFSAEFEGVQLVESSMDSARQIDALLSEQLDVAILRVTPQMLAERPHGWRRRLIRLEPLLLIGRPGDRERESASLHERPVEVFADATRSPLFNVHGEYLAAFERQTRVALRWLGNPGTFGHCLAAVRRAHGSAFTLEYESYAQRYAEAGVPVHRPAELQPVYPWWVAWREDNASESATAFVRTAMETSARHRWLQPGAAGRAPIWMPSDDPAVLEPLPS
ncbi:MAG: LysR family transcriptional regulator [Aeromicrobium sp.]